MVRLSLRLFSSSPALANPLTPRTVVTRTWSNPDGISNSTWALLLTQNIKKALALTDGAAKPTFGGVLAGGCCKAGPEAIQELRKELVKEKLVKV